MVVILTDLWLAIPEGVGASGDLLGSENRGLSFIFRVLGIFETESLFPGWFTSFSSNGDKGALVHGLDSQYTFLSA